MRLTTTSSRDNLRSALLSSYWSSCENHSQSPAVSASLNQCSNPLAQEHTSRGGSAWARHRSYSHELCPHEVGPDSGWSVAGHRLQRAESVNNFWVKKMKIKQQSVTAVSLPHFKLDDKTLSYCEVVLTVFRRKVWKWRERWHLQIPGFLILHMHGWNQYVFYWQYPQDTDSSE